MTTEEIWVPVRDFDGCYEVSNLGKVRAIHSRNRFAKPSIRILKQNLTVWGYRTVSLSKLGKVTSRAVHRIVLESFVGLKPENKEAGHMDGNKENNNLSNLRWITHKENMQHLVIHGTAPKPWKFCKKGHQLTEDNVYRSKGKQRCKLCVKTADSKRDQSKKWKREKARAAIARAEGK